MKNVKLLELLKHGNVSKYEPAGEYIFKSLEEEHYVFAITYELEDGENSQYPLEDILDRFYLHVSDFIDEEKFTHAKIVDIELAGDLDDVRNAIREIVGRRIFNSEYVGENGKVYMKLNIE